MTNYYNKSETDALLNDKADVSDLPDMTNYYTKSEVDTKITDLYQIKTVSGSVVNITDGADNIPVKSLVSQIVAVESGSGEKSPENPYTISGFDNGIITRCGKNLAKNELVTGTVAGITYTNNNDGTFTVNGTATGDSYRYLTQTVQKTYKGNFVVSVNINGNISGNWLLQVTTRYLSDDSVKQRIVVNSTTLNKAFTIGNDEYFSDIIFRMYSGSSASNAKISVQIEVGDTATTYEAYNGNTYTFAFGQTVYGGHFDNKGNLVVTHGVVDLGSLTWRYAPTPKIFNAVLSPIPFSDGDCLSSIYERIPANRLANDLTQNYKMALGWIITNNCINIRNTDYTDVTAFKTAMNGVMLVYKLKTPITLEIESQDIPTLLGENNIFSNCGDLEVQYFTSKSDGIAELIRAFL